jgi:hypothetical protein
MEHAASLLGPKCMAFRGSMSATVWTSRPPEPSQPKCALAGETGVAGGPGALWLAGDPIQLRTRSRVC